MATNANSDKSVRLDSEQIIDAKQALGCGLTVTQVAKHFQISERQLRIELGIPVRNSEETGGES
jgi:hypothetical protein